MYSMDRPTLIIFAALATALLILFSGCVEQTGNLTNSLGKAKCKLNTYSNYMKGRHTGSYYDIAWSNKTTASTPTAASNLLLTVLFWGTFSI